MVGTYADLYIKRNKDSLFLISGTFPTLKLPKKAILHQRSNFFSDAILVSNYHGCKGGTIKLLPYYDDKYFI